MWLDSATIVDESTHRKSNRGLTYRKWRGISTGKWQNEPSSFSKPQTNTLNLCVLDNPQKSRCRLQQGLKQQPPNRTEKTVLHWLWFSSHWKTVATPSTNPMQNWKSIARVIWLLTFFRVSGSLACFHFEFSLAYSHTFLCTDLPL